MKGWWARIQYWMLMVLLNRHRDFSRISSDGPPSGHYDTYWVFAAEDKTVPGGHKGDSEAEIVYLLKRSSQKHLLAQRRSKDGKEGRHPRNKIAPDFLKGKELEIRHYYRDILIIHKWILICFIYRFARFYWLTWLFRSLIEKVSQWNYERRFQVISDRISVLNAVIELNDKGVEWPTFIHITEHLHGNRLLLSGEMGQKAMNKVTGVLESLVAEGCLLEAGMGFKTTKSALSTLLSWEQEHRRERIVQFSQIMMIVLTAVLALSSVAGNLIAYCGATDHAFCVWIGFGSQ